MNSSIQKGLQSNEVKRKKRQIFTPQEDTKIRELVGKYGDNDWGFIARVLGGRTPRQCRDRWKEYLMPTLNMAPWTIEEDNLLIQKINECGKKWSIICMALNGRSETAAKNRWRLLERRNFALVAPRSKISSINSAPTSESPSTSRSLPKKQAKLPRLPSLTLPMFPHHTELDKLFSSLSLDSQQNANFTSLVPPSSMLQIF